MNAKDKFVFGVLAALIVGAFYFQYLTDELNMRMDDLNLADKKHVDIVLNEFTVKTSISEGGLPSKSTFFRLRRSPVNSHQLI